MSQCSVNLLGVSKRREKSCQIVNETLPLVPRLWIPAECRYTQALISGTEIGVKPLSERGLQQRLPSSMQTDPVGLDPNQSAIALHVVSCRWSV